MKRMAQQRKRTEKHTPRDSFERTRFGYSPSRRAAIRVRSRSIYPAYPFIYRDRRLVEAYDAKDIGKLDDLVVPPAKHPWGQRVLMPKHDEIKRQLHPRGPAGI